MRFERTLGMLGFSCLALLGVVTSLPAQTAAGAPPFLVMRVPQGFQLLPHMGALTITDATVRFDANNPEHSLVVPIEDISKVTGHTKLKRVTIKLNTGESYTFAVLKPVDAKYPVRVEPLVDALTAAMSGQSATTLPPTQTPPKRSFAPIPAPSMDAPAIVATAVGQTAEQVAATTGAWQFGGFMSQNGPFLPSRGLLTITAATVTFNADDGEYSLEVPIQDISKVRVNTYNRVAISLKKGETDVFIAFKDGNPAPVGPVVEALIAAKSGQSGPILLPAITPPKRNFAPIPPPAAPSSAPVAPVGIVVGQPPDQVKAVLGQPDRIDLLPSLEKINRIVWYYNSLTVTFVDGKVSAVDQGGRPPGLNTVR